MLHWPNNPGIMGDDPPYLAVGTEVSAKYKGAFCEAKVSKVVHSVKCKVVYKLGLGSAIVTDDQIRGTLRVGSVVEVKHSEKKEFVEATISKVQDCSQYTVVFDDGDITTLRRTALCLKSGRHFAESETLDQLPLTHPEHFGNPVVGGRRGGRRSRNAGSNESSDEEESPQKKSRDEREADTGKVVCVELGDKKKAKDNWFPGLVVSPTAQEAVRIRVKDEYLVRSFKDGRYFTVPKKEVTEFTREIGAKVDNNTLKTAVEKALLYMDRNELPPHWDRELIFGLDSTLSSGDSDDGGSDSDSSDDEPREEKDHFVAQLYKFMDDRGTPINRGPTISNRDVDLYKLFKVVHKLGGYNRVTNHNQWKTVSHKLGFGQVSNIANLVKSAYKKFLHSFEDFYRKLGCTMVNHPRGNRARHRGGRSLIRDRDRATPTITPRSDNKDKGDEGDDSVEGTENKEEPAEEREKDKKEEKEEDSTRKDRKDATKTKDVPQTEDERPQRSTKREEKSVRKEEKGTSGASGATPSPAAASAAASEATPARPTALPPELTTPKSKTYIKKTVSPLVSETRRVRTGQKVKAKTDDNGPVDEEDESADDDEDDSEKPTNTRSKSKDDPSRAKKEAAPVELRARESRPDTDKKSSRPTGSDASEKKAARPAAGSGSASGSAAGASSGSGSGTGSGAASAAAAGASTDKRTQRPSLSLTSDRKTVRSLAAEFEKKAARLGASSDPEKKSVASEDKKSKPAGSDDKKARLPVAASSEKKNVKAISADEGKRSVKTPTSDSDKQEKKIRSVLSNEPERKKVRPSLTANPEKKRVDSEKREGDQRVQSGEGSGDGSEADRKIKTKRRKDTDDSETLNVLPSYKNVAIGDKLKVYYGPTHEYKVTYEAKVLEIRGEGTDATYLVHYTGWNTRYDEWIKRVRIADNLSWNPARAKRRHQAQLTAGKKASTKRVAGTKQQISRDSNSPQQVLQQSQTSGNRESQPPRSTTPSSVTSSSSRTKSPATRPGSARLARQAESSNTQVESTKRRRTRRLSGHLDISTVSETESEAYESESEPEPSQTRKSSRKTTGESEDGGPSKRRIIRRVEVDQDEDEDDDDEADDREADEKVKRPRRTPRLHADPKSEVDEIKSEIDIDEDPVLLEPPRGRDFDLNQIRSELKGIDRTVKLPTEDKPEKSDKAVKETVPEVVIKEEIASPERVAEKKPAVEVEEEMEDIYEFKEPEPFEFEVRGKRDSPVDSNKIGKRPLALSGTSPKREPWSLDSPESKAAPPKKRPLPTPLRNPDLDSSDDGSPSRKRYRRTVPRRDGEDKEDKVETPAPVIKIEPGDVIVETIDDTAHEAPREPPRDQKREPPRELKREPVREPIRETVRETVRETTHDTARDAPRTAEPMSPQKRLLSSVDEQFKLWSMPNYQSVRSQPSAPPSSSSGSALASTAVHGATAAPVPPTPPTPSTATTSVPAASPTVPTSPSAPPPLLPVVSAPSDPAPAAFALTTTASATQPSKPADATVSSPSSTGTTTPKVSAAAADSLIKLAVHAERQSPTRLPALKSELETFDELTALENSPKRELGTPEPPQLLPIFGASPKATFGSSCKAEKMPLIKHQDEEEDDDDDDDEDEDDRQDQERSMDESEKAASPRRRKAPLRRKKTTSSEFMDDFDSESSTGSRRLVIDRHRSESSGSDSESDTHTGDLLRRVKDNDEDNASGAQPTTATTTEVESEEGASTASTTTVGSTTSSTPAGREASLASDAGASTVTGGSVGAGTSVPAANVQGAPVQAASPPPPLAAPDEDTEEGDNDSSLRSLLCEETIPGSPAPPAEAPPDSVPEKIGGAAAGSDSERMVEMPFASAPSNSSSASVNVPLLQLREEAAASSLQGVSTGRPSPITASESNQAASNSVENSPPTTPDSSLSTLSTSPREERAESPPLVKESKVLPQGDNYSDPNRVSLLIEEDMGRPTKRPGNVASKSMEREPLTERQRDAPMLRRDVPVGRREVRQSNSRHFDRNDDADEDREDCQILPKKRRRSHKASESEDRAPLPAKRSRVTMGRQVKVTGGGSDSDENIDPDCGAPIQVQVPGASSENRSSRPSKYNFCVDLPPELDSTERIALIMQKIQELRKTYMAVKSELAVIDRRRKKLRRRDREEKAASKDTCS